MRYCIRSGVGNAGVDARKGLKIMTTTSTNERRGEDGTSRFYDHRLPGSTPRMWAHSGTTP